MPDPAKPPIDPSPEFQIEPVAPGLAGKISAWAASALTALLRFAFHLLYHQLAFSYDAVAWIVSAGEWAEWRRSVIPYLPPGRVLEIAHGTGTLSLDMAARGHSVTGIDLSPAMGKIARAKILRRRRSAADLGPVWFRRTFNGFRFRQVSSRRRPPPSRPTSFSSVRPSRRCIARCVPAGSGSSSPRRSPNGLRSGGCRMKER
jgi:SAM-dependent methyltransferase